MLDVVVGSCLVFGGGFVMYTVGVGRGIGLLGGSWCTLTVGLLFCSSGAISCTVGGIWVRYWAVVSTPWALALLVGGVCLVVRQGQWETLDIYYIVARARRS